MTHRVIRLALASALVFATACKKKPKPVEPTPPPPPPAPVEAPQAAPEEVVTMVQNFQRIYFNLDSAALDGSSKAALDDNIQIMQENPDIKIQLQGHADERGTTDYNLALGERRANSVRSYMTGQGVAPSRLTVVSFGEERPLASGSTESAWSRNRRAEFVITWGEDENVHGTTN